MENISPEDLALELFQRCLQGGEFSKSVLDALLDQALGDDAAAARCASQALFRGVAERLADCFEPRLCDAYAEVFSHVLSRACGRWEPDALLERYRRIRMPRRFQTESDVTRVLVLSRVTLGADVAITSVILDAACKRFPGAEIVFAGPGKNYALFAGRPGISLLELPYPKEGTLRERLSVLATLEAACADPGAIVIDPDSRLTQLGLLPVCPEQRYYFFESRSYGGDSDESLPSLTHKWLEATFGVAGSAFIEVGQPPIDADITVSLGTGENAAKRMDAWFERELLCALAATGCTVLVDRGGSDEEAARVERAAQGLPNVTMHQGSFAAFAACIASSRLYCGYDSAGQHVAAACGVPLVAVFAGYPSERFLARWRPQGPSACEVVAAGGHSSSEVLRRTLAALKRLGTPTANSPGAWREPKDNGN